MNLRRETGFILPDAPLVRATGRLIGYDVEVHRDPEEVDHFWIHLNIGAAITVSVNSLSTRNRAAGFDPRIRVGRVRGSRVCLPEIGAVPWQWNDYADIEAATNVFYEHQEREQMEDLLGGLCRRAHLIEALGAPYRRRGEGIHQVHSRRASCAVADDVVGLDGSLTFYEEDGVEMLLFKFCGQP